LSEYYKNTNAVGHMWHNLLPWNVLAAVLFALICKLVGSEDYQWN